MPKLHDAIRGNGDFKAELSKATPQQLREGESIAALPGVACTPLVLAAHLNKFELVQQLLAKGDAVTGDAQSMGIAVTCAAAHNNSKMVAALLNAGASANVRHNGISALSNVFNLIASDAGWFKTEHQKAPSANRKVIPVQDILPIVELLLPKLDMGKSRSQFDSTNDYVYCLEGIASFLRAVGNTSRFQDVLNHIEAKLVEIGFSECNPHTAENRTKELWGQYQALTDKALVDRNVMLHSLVQWYTNTLEPFLLNWGVAQQRFIADAKTVPAAAAANDATAAMTIGLAAAAAAMSVKDAKKAGDAKAQHPVKKFDINAVDSQGNTALHLALPRHIGMLIDYGANPNARNLKGETPLMLAAGRRDKKAVELLLGEGDITLRDHAGHTALDHWIEAYLTTYGDNLDILELLVKHNVPVNHATLQRIPEPKAVRILHAGFIMTEMRTGNGSGFAKVSFNEENTQIDFAFADGETILSFALTNPLFVRLINEKVLSVEFHGGVAPNSSVRAMDAFLAGAVRRNYPNSIKALLKHGANVNAVMDTKEGSTIFMVAAQHDSLKTLVPLPDEVADDKSAGKQLDAKTDGKVAADLKLNLEAKNACGQTALLLAAMKKPGNVPHLMRLGAKSDVVDTSDHGVLYSMVQHADLAVIREVCASKKLAPKTGLQRPAEKAIWVTQMLWTRFHPQHASTAENWFSNAMATLVSLGAPPAEEFLQFKLMQEMKTPHLQGTAVRILNQLEKIFDAHAFGALYVFSPDNVFPIERVLDMKTAFESDEKRADCLENLLSVAPQTQLALLKDAAKKQALANGIIKPVIEKYEKRADIIDLAIHLDRQCRDNKVDKSELKKQVTLFTKLMKLANQAGAKSEDIGVAITSEISLFAKFNPYENILTHLNASLSENSKVVENKFKRSWRRFDKFREHYHSHFSALTTYIERQNEFSSVVALMRCAKGPLVRKAAAATSAGSQAAAAVATAAQGTGHLAAANGNGNSNGAAAGSGAGADPAAGGQAPGFYLSATFN